MSMSLAGQGAQLNVTELLNHIWASDLPRAVRSHLATGAVTQAVHPELAPPRLRPHDLAGARVRDVEVELEKTLQLVGAAGIPDAKAKLRARGPDGRRLASQLGRLSSARSVWAHPKGDLPERVTQLIQVQIV